MSRCAGTTRRLPPICSPAIVVDTREQRPYGFAGLFSGEITVSNLDAGDYSIAGYTDRVSVERKSLVDLYGTLGKGRARFERELARLDRLDFAAVVIEAEWSEILGSPPTRSTLSPRSIFRSVVAWMQRHTHVHWLAMPGRDAAEGATFRILERFCKERGLM